MEKKKSSGGCADRAHALRPPGDQGAEKDPVHRVYRAILTKSPPRMPSQTGVERGNKWGNVERRTSIHDE